MQKIITESGAETALLGKKIARLLKGGDVLALTGNLGSGKTTFVKGVAAGLGIRTKIKSPTFVIVSPHPVPKNKQTFYHFDLYRLRSARDLSDLGFAEIINDKNHLAVVEWPQKARKFLPKHTIYIRFTHGSGKNPHQRIISIN